MLDAPPTADAQLNAGITACGDLILLIVREMKVLTSGQVLRVVGHDPGAREDIPAWCRMTGKQLLYYYVPEDRSQPADYYIQKGI